MQTEHTNRSGRKQKRAHETESKLYARRITSLIRERGISHESLARAIGVQRQTVDNYCNGQSAPNCEALSAIAEHFNVSADYILGRSDLRKEDMSAEYASHVLGLTLESADVLTSLDVRCRDAGADIVNRLLSSPLLPGVIRELVGYRSGIRRQTAYCRDGGVSEDFARQMRDMGDMYMMKAQRAFYKLLCDAMGYDDLLKAIEENKKEALPR